MPYGTIRGNMQQTTSEEEDLNEVVKRQLFKSSTEKIDEFKQRRFAKKM